MIIIIRIIQIDTMFGSLYDIIKILKYYTGIFILTLCLYINVSTNIIGRMNDKDQEKEKRTPKLIDDSKRMRLRRNKGGRRNSTITVYKT